MIKLFTMLAAAGAFTLCGCATTETTSADKPAHPCTMEKGGAGHQCMKGKECRHDGKDGHQCKMKGKDAQGQTGHQCKMEGKDQAGHQCKMDGKDAKGQAGHQCKMSKEAAAPAAK